MQMKIFESLSDQKQALICLGFTEMLENLLL